MACLTLHTLRSSLSSRYPHFRLSLLSWNLADHMVLWLVALGLATSTFAQNTTRSYFTLPNDGTLPFNITTQFSDLSTQVAENAYFLTCIRGENVPHAAPAIFDTQGDLVWMSPTLGECFNLDQQIYNGSPVLTVWVGKVQAAGWGAGQGVILDSSYSIIKNVTTNSANGADIHEFNIPTDTNSTALLTTYNPIPADLSPFGGPANGWLLDSLFQEVDIASGSVIFNWSAADHIPLNGSFAAPGASGTAQDNPWDAFHMNSIDKDANGNYLLSSRHCHQIYQISKDTGDIMWRLGGNGTNFQMGNGTAFFWQHHVRWQNNFTHMSIFDNGASNWQADEPFARGLYLAVDTTAMTANLVQEYLPVHRNYSQSQGSMQMLPNGNVVVGYGSNPYITEHTSDGTVIYSSTIGPDSFGDNSEVGNYRAIKTTTWVGHPKDPPTVAAVNGTSGLDLYASWNGATHVAAYTLLAGTNATALIGVTNISRTAFETHIQGPSGQDYIAVVALASDGSELGRTGVMRVSDGTMVLAGSVASPSATASAGGGSGSRGDNKNDAAPRHVRMSGAVGAIVSLVFAWLLC